MDGLYTTNLEKIEEEIHGSFQDDEVSYIPEPDFQDTEKQPGVHPSAMAYPSLPPSAVTGQPLPSQPLNREAALRSTGATPSSTNDLPPPLSTPSNSTGNVQQDFLIPARLSLIQGANGKKHVGYIISGTNDVTTAKTNVIPSQSSPGNPGNPGTTLLMAPPSLPSAPPGLTSLALVNKILIDRKDDMCKAKGFSLHKYMILNESGYRMYMALEEHFAWKKFGSGCHEKLMVHFVDETGTEIIKATRELTFSDCEILVEAAVGEVCGYVRKTSGGHVVLNSNKDTVLTIRDAIAPFCLCGRFDSKVIGMDGSIVGQVELENFSSQSSVTFPKDLDFKMKAVLLSFAILNKSH